MKQKIIQSKRENYILKTKRDIKILNLCKKLEKSNVSKNDKELVKLIKTQLEKDWRKHLIIKLDKLVKKYLK
jgi:hypothetical protein